MSKRKLVGDAITLDRIALAHPILREKLKEQYLYVNNYILGKGVRLRFAWVYRSPEDQNKMYAKGRSKPGRKVTKAKAWQSIHQYALAFDIVLLLDTDGNGTFEKASWDVEADYDGDLIADWKEVVDYFKATGDYEWGGDWNSPDEPHFQLKGYHWRKLKPLLDNGKVIKEGKMIYPDLCYYPHS